MKVNNKVKKNISYLKDKIKLKEIQYVGIDIKTKKPIVITMSKPEFIEFMKYTMDKIKKNGKR
jgi:hypothetical protein